MVKVELGLSTMIGLLRMLAASREAGESGLSGTERQTLKDNLISAVVSELEGIGVVPVKPPTPMWPPQPATTPAGIPNRIQLTVEESSFIYSLLGYHVIGARSGNMSLTQSIMGKVWKSVPPQIMLNYTKLPTAHNKHCIFLA